jgi:hypothetical protein
VKDGGIVCGGQQHPLVDDGAAGAAVELRGVPVYDVGLRVGVPRGRAVIAVMGNHHATLRASFCRSSPTITATVIRVRITSEHRRRVPVRIE